MVIVMNETKLSTIAQLREILDGTCEVRFERVEDDAKRYAFIESVLRRVGYRRLGREGQLRFLGKGKDNAV